MTAPRSALATGWITFSFVILSVGVGMMAADRGTKELMMKAKEHMKTTNTNKHVQLRCRSDCGIERLERLFKIMDDDGSNTLDVDEFKDVIKDYGLVKGSPEENTKAADERTDFNHDPPTKEELDDETRDSFSYFDKDSSGDLDFDEFLDAFRPPMPQVRQDMIHQTFYNMDTNGDGLITVDDLEGVYDATRHPTPPMPQVRQDMINQAFDSIDTNGDGLITVDDLEGVYDATKHPKYLSGEWTEEKVIQNFIDSFDKDKDGNVSRQEFLRFYSGLSASIRDDAYFNRLIGNAE